MKKTIFIIIVSVISVFGDLPDSEEPQVGTQSGQDINSQSEIELRERALEAERRALEAERRALEAERQMAQREREELELRKELADFERRVINERSERPEERFPRALLSAVGDFGWHRLTCDRLAVIFGRDDPLDGVSFGAGAVLFFPVGDIFGVRADMVNFGFTAGIGHSSLSLSQDGSKITLSLMALDFAPTLRIGDRKRYTDISFNVLSPLLADLASKAPGYQTEKIKIENLETGVGIGIFSRYNIIGIGYDRNLRRSRAASLSLNELMPKLERHSLKICAFMPRSKELEIIPSFQYLFGEYASEIILSIGFGYSF